MDPGIVIVEDLVIGNTSLGHVHRTFLAQSNAMTVSPPFEDHGICNVFNVKISRSK